MSYYGGILGGPFFLITPGNAGGMRASWNSDQHGNGPQCWLATALGSVHCRQEAMAYIAICCPSPIVVQGLLRSALPFENSCVIVRLHSQTSQWLLTKSAFIFKPCVISLPLYWATRHLRGPCGKRNYHTRDASECCSWIRPLGIAPFMPTGAASVPFWQSSL